MGATLADRRVHFTYPVEWRGQAFQLGIGFDDQGLAREIFVERERSGGELLGLLKDSCKLVSYLLRSDAAPAVLCERMAPDGALHRLLSVVVAREAEDGAAVRAALWPLEERAVDA